MIYEDFINVISKNDKLKIIKCQNDDDFFGNFQIILLFRKILEIEIVNDRGIIEIFILFKKKISKCRIPLWFAVKYVECKDYSERLVFENINSANEYLIYSINALELIAQKNIMRDIAKDWKNELI